MRRNILRHGALLAHCSRLLPRFLSCRHNGIQPPLSCSLSFHFWQDYSLAGSLLTLDTALKNAVQAGIPLPEASRMLSAVPARSMGLTDRGELAVGQRADFVVLGRDLNGRAVYVGGQQVAGAGA